MEDLLSENAGLKKENKELRKDNKRLKLKLDTKNKNQDDNEWYFGTGLVYGTDLSKKSQYRFDLYLINSQYLERLKTTHKTL